MKRLKTTVLEGGLTKTVGHRSSRGRRGGNWVPDGAVFDGIPHRTEVDFMI